MNSCSRKKIKSLDRIYLEDVVNKKILDIFDLEVKELPQQYFDPELVSFVDEFVEDAKKNGIIIPNQTREKLRVIKYVDTLSVGSAPGVIAACSRYSLRKTSLRGNVLKKYFVIEVLRKESIDFTEGHRIILRELVYHELFHCFLNKGHLPIDVPGIMNPTFKKGNRRSFEDWDGLVREMFSPEYLEMIPDAR